MTISSDIRTAGPFTGTGLVSVYAFAFKVFAAAEVVATSTNTSGVLTTLTQPTHYTVTLNSNQNTSPGGTITLAAPLASGFRLEIGSEIAATQGASLPNQGGWFPAVVEDALDRLTILAQQMGGGTSNRNLRVPELGGIDALPSISDRAGKLMSFNGITGAPEAVAAADQSATQLAIDLASTAAGDGAAMVGSEDVGGYFSGTNAEAQSQEIGSAFGLPGGVTTAILQAAINARSLTLSSGTTYELTSTLQIPSNRTLRLNGATIKRQTGSGVYDLIANADQIGGNGNIKIIGPGTIDGNAAADSLLAANPADRFSGVSLVLVTGSSEVSGVTVTGTVNAEAHAGIYLSDCSDVRVSGNNATANDRTGILVFDSVRTMVINNHAWANAGSGISGGGNTDCEYIGNHCHNNGSGGNYSGLNASGLRSRVVGNLSHDNTGAGIAVGEVAHPSNEAIVTSNQAYENTLDGLAITNSARVMAANNVLRANVRDGVRVQTSSSEITLVGNCINDNTSLGINLNVGSKHTVRGNRVSGNGATGISIGAVADCTVSGNTAWNNGTVTTANSAGILVNTCTGMIVSGNRCFDSAGAGGTQESGIWMAGGSNNVVEHNVVTGNKTNAIRESSAPAYNRRGNKVGTDPLTGTFTAGAGATHVVNNNNAPGSASMVLVYATNAAALARPPICSAVVAGTSLTVSSTGAFAGTETYRYEILS